MENKFNYNDTLEFRQIVLGHIKKILEISSAELRNATRRVNKGNFTEIIEQEDTRVSYRQAIENLAYILIPYFDNEIIKIYDETVKILDYYEYEIQDYYKKEYSDICKKLNQEKLSELQLIAFMHRIKLRNAKKLFIELNKLLHRNDYLKSTVYGDESDEVASESENEGGE
jgi:hypothetical protein